MKEVFFEEIFEYKKKSKVKAGDGLKLNEGTYPFFTSSNTLSKSLDEFLFEHPSLIFGTGGMPSIHFCEEKFSVSTDCLVAQPRNDESVYIPYIYYFFTKNDMRILQDGFKGAGLKHISRKYIDKIKIPLPPIKTQQRIASILDDAAALRDKTAQLLTEYDLLAQSIFLEMFGDPGTNAKQFEIRQLDEFYISEKEGTKCGPFGGALKKQEFVEEGIAVWNMDNIEKNGELNSKIKLWITEEKYLSLKAYNVVNNDIIISRAGTVGKMTVVNSSYTESIISTNLIRLRLDSSKLLPLFFSKMMNYFKERVGRLKTGAEGSFTHMNTGVLNNLKFPYPPIELQNQFAEKIALIEQQKALAKQELQESEDLFNCLLQKAFKGAL